MLLVLLYFLYLYETRTMLDTFNCAPTEPDDGKEYLQVVFEACGEPGGTQEKLLPWSLVGLAVYTVGYPAFVLYWVLYRNRFLIMEDQLLRAKGVGNDRLTNPHALDFRRMFGHARMDAAVGSVDGTVRFFGLTPTSMKLEGLDRHHRLLDSYKKLHARRARVA
jgi:hypothetical protein